MHAVGHPHACKLQGIRQGAQDCEDADSGHWPHAAPASTLQRAHLAHEGVRRIGAVVALEVAGGGVEVLGAGVPPHMDGQLCLVLPEVLGKPARPAACDARSYCTAESKGLWVFRPRLDPRRGAMTVQVSLNTPSALLATSSSKHGFVELLEQDNKRTESQVGAQGGSLVLICSLDR